MSENKVKHLEMIQGVINRLSTNSFLLKGWSVLLVSALVALGAKDSNPHFVLLAYFPAFIFWALDGYFLRQERLFRALYDKVRAADEAKVDFSMDTSPVASKVPGRASVAWSSTLRAFHGTVTLTILVIMVVMMTKR